MNEPLATNTHPKGFNRVPSNNGGATGSGEVTWDEMGQRGLHKALNEYYKLSASQRSLRLCGSTEGGNAPPTALCCLVYRVLVPQLPDALAPPALLAALAWLLTAAAWMIYITAPITIPAVLWFIFAAEADGLALPHGVLAVAECVHPGIGAAIQRLATAQRQMSPLATAAAAIALLLALRWAEARVVAGRQQRWAAQQRRVTAADVQAHYAGWQPPHDSNAGTATVKVAVSDAEEEQQQQQQQLLAVVRGEVGRLYSSVFGTQAPSGQLDSIEGIWTAVERLCTETGVLPPVGGPRRSSNAPEFRTLLDAIERIKLDVGVE